jgi:hypothetical protein
MNASSGGNTSADIATPLSRDGFFSSLLAGPALPALIARLGARIAAWWSDPIRFGDTVMLRGTATSSRFCTATSIS